MDDGAASRHDRASDDGGDVHGDLSVGQLNDVLLVGDGAVGPGEDPRRAAVAVPNGPAAKCDGPRGRIGLALSYGAPHEGQQHAVSLPHVRHLAARGDDHPRRLVAEHHGTHRVGPMYLVYLRMANAGGELFDDDVGWSGIRQVEILDDQRLVVFHADDGSSLHEASDEGVAVAPDPPWRESTRRPPSCPAAELFLMIGFSTRFQE
jgi:hypothetical protein